MAHTTYPLTIGGKDAMGYLPSWQAKSAQGLQRAVVWHGHGAVSATTFQQGDQNWKNLLAALADRCGLAIIGVFVANGWINQATIDSGLDALAYLDAQGADPRPAVNLGFSMGGGDGLRFHAEHPDKVACTRVYSPLTNLAWAHGDPYGSNWNIEINTAYGNNYAGLGAPRSPISTPALFRTGKPIFISHPSDDAVVPQQHSIDFVAAVNDPLVTLRNVGDIGGHIPGDTDDQLVRWVQDHRGGT